MSHAEDNSIEITAATLFSGIGAPETAMPHWHWPWHAEIEKFPSAVLASRHPNSINIGDVTSHDFTERAASVAKPSVLVFGSPCQSFSVAGKRLGLDDPRGNLALYALGIVDRLKPNWFVFENVPGLLSASEGRDFGLFLRTVDELGYSLAWTVLDAQHFGVAQRRKRVFAVGYLGDWRYPAAILFEPEGLCGDHPPRRKAGERPAPTIASRPTGGGGLGTDFDCDGGLIAGTLGLRSVDHPSGLKSEADFLVASCITTRENSLDLESSNLIAATVTSKWSKGSGGPAGVECGNLVAHTLDSFSAGRMTEDGTGRGCPIVQAAPQSVRRLTPRECERLQGYPDDYTAITFQGKLAADGPRYKAIGNSMAVPVMRWILTRIEAIVTNRNNS